MSYSQASTVTGETAKGSFTHIVKGAKERSNVQEIAGFSFDDLLDLINPLHHIPVVGQAYREATGDSIHPGVQMAGDLMYGAATGSVLLNGAMSVAAMMYENKKGEEPLTQLAGIFVDEEDGGYVTTDNNNYINTETDPDDTLYLASLAEPPVTSTPLPVETLPVTKDVVPPINLPNTLPFGDPKEFDVKLDEKYMPLEESI